MWQSLCHFTAVVGCQEEPSNLGFAVSQWSPFATALPRRLAERLRGVFGIPDQGWQHDASSFVERRFFNSSIWPLLVPRKRALLRSQGGPLSGLPFTSLPVSASLVSTLICSESSSCGDVAFLFPLSSCSCWCGPSLDCLAITAQVARGQGVGSRWSLLQRVCAEKHEHESRPILRDLDLLSISASDQRRIEVIAERLPAFHGALVSSLRADGNGAVLQAARSRKRSYPELSGEMARAKLVVLAGEIGGPFSEETQTFIRLLARAKTRSVPEPLRTRARQSRAQG